MSEFTEVSDVIATGKTFLDTSVIVYANDRADPERQELSLVIVSDLIRSGRGVISTQVLME